MAPSLRLITYLVPSHPVELYECIAHFLEEELGVNVTLHYESRNPIDLFDNRPDPFLLNEADIGTFANILLGTTSQKANDPSALNPAERCGCYYCVFRSFQRPMSPDRHSFTRILQKLSQNFFFAPFPRFVHFSLETHI